MEAETNSNNTFSFGDFVLSGARRSLLKNGEPVFLNSKTLDLLLVLVENHGQVLSKNELLEKVWEDQFVEENNLSVQISALRKIFGEKKGEHQFIATIPGKGYKFVAEINQTNDEIIIENHKIERITIDEITETPLRSLKEKPFKRRMIYASAVLVLLIAASAFFAFRYFSNVSQAKINSLAVLPFVNETGEADNEYLSDGLTESVIYRLSQSPDLKVLSRNSVFRYKGKDTDAKVIGDELNVQAVLIGRFSQSSGNFNVSAELISTADNSVIWGERFTRRAADIAKLQSDIAASISDKLRFKFSGVKPSGAQNAEAYRLYLKGRFQWNKRSIESLKQSVEFYKQAIEIEPNYALAFSGLAESYVIFPSYNVASPNESMPQAKAAALRALELDETLSEAHTALAYYLGNYEWNRAEAERQYRRAIELNPNYATAHQWLGIDHLAQLKRFDEALAELKIAEELDPLSPAIGMNLGSLYSMMKRYDEAISQYKIVIERTPDFSVTRSNLSLVYYRKGMYLEAIDENRKALELSGDPLDKAFLAFFLIKAGQRAEAIKLLDEVKREAAQRYVPNYGFALIYIALDEKDEALFWLEKEMNERSYWANVYAVDAELDPLRDEPRFKAMLKKMNLPE